MQQNKKAIVLPSFFVYMETLGENATNEFVRMPCVYAKIASKH